MAKHPHQEEALFAISQQTGQIVERDFSDDPELAVSLDERSIHLQNSITYLAHMSMLKGFLSYGSLAEQEYGERAETVRRNATDRIARLSVDAKKEFAAASGHYDMIEAGHPENEVKRQTRGMFSDFIKKYYGGRHYKEAQAYRRHLANGVDMRRDGQPVEVEVRPMHVVPPVEYETLNNHEKLEVLLEDPNAAFLPATNREKTTALTLLSYVNDPKGTSQQRLEIFRHAQRFGFKNAGARQGIRAVESVMYETGDYAANALQSHNRLLLLQDALGDVLNPNLTLEVALGEHHPGYGPLLRYIELRKLYDAEEEKVLPYPVDPMRTVEDRWTREGEGKHKVVHDRYTLVSPEERVKEEMEELARTTRVVDARGIIPDALTNEEARAAFFTERLKDLENLDKVSRVFKGVVQATVNVILENEAA